MFLILGLAFDFFIWESEFEGNFCLTNSILV